MFCKGEYVLRLEEMLLAYNLATFSLFSGMWGVYAVHNLLDGFVGERQAG
jgi:hypothetical protein